MRKLAALDKRMQAAVNSRVGNGLHGVIDKVAYAVLVVGQVALVLG